MSVGVIALLLHGWIVTRDWSTPALTGHEFRQTQTAIIARYIDKQNNFSVDYDTPILGKPWRIPLEFPLYQWAVVGVQRLTPLTNVQAARMLSLVSFYGTLGAVFLLLGDIGVRVAARWLILAVVLCTPVYLFYARAFLIDPMATCFSAWFLAAFVRTLGQRDWRWGLLCTLAATAAALIKSVLFFVWLVPAAAWGAWRLWESWKQEKVGAAIGNIILWGIGPMVLPAVSLLWWIRHTDEIKQTHPSGWIFTSEALSRGNWGMFSVTAWLDWAMWERMMARWSETLMPPFAVVAIVLTGWLIAARWRVALLGTMALFLVGQVAFPYAYADQDYYFYAAAIFAAVAIGIAMVGLLECDAWPRLLRMILVLLPLGLLHQSYAAGYQDWLARAGENEWAVTKALREYLPEDSVIIVVGEDWSAVVPYFSHKRALMIRRGLERDDDYLVRAFTDLDGEDVSALLLFREYRDLNRLAGFAQDRFQLDSEPTFKSEGLDVYIARRYRDRLVDEVGQDRSRFFDITELAADATDRWEGRTPLLVSGKESAKQFPLIDAKVTKVLAEHFPNLREEGQSQTMNLHPDMDIWLETDVREGVITWEFGIVDAAFAGNGANDHTDGVDFLVVAESANGKRRRPLFRRLLNPAARPEDRGLQRFEFGFELDVNEQMVIVIRGGFSRNYDWAYGRQFEITPLTISASDHSH